MSYARAERAALCALLDETGPDAPTLCEGWSTLDLAAHRRAQPGWQPRALGRGMSDALWLRLRAARVIMRKAPVGVELARSDEPPPAPSGAPTIRLTANARTPVVTVTGTPAELTLWALGRTAAARVRLDGSEADIRALNAARRRS